MTDSLTLHAREAARAELARKVALDQASMDRFYDPETHWPGWANGPTAARMMREICPPEKLAANLERIRRSIPPRGVDPQLDAKFDAAERALAERKFG